MSRSHKWVLFIALVIGTLDVSSLAQNTVGNFSRIFLNGNRLDMVAGTSVVRLPAVTGQLPVCTTTTLTNAQIIALPTTPVTVVAAPGAGYAVEPMFAAIRTNTTAGAYGGIDADAEFRIRFSATAQGMGYIVNDTLITNGSATLVTDLLGSTTNKRAVLIPEQSTEGVDSWGPVPIVDAASGFTNTALKVDMDNSGVLSGGNAANSMSIALCYIVVPVP